MIRLPNIHFWIYQNPPCIPGLFCLVLVKLFRRRSRIILDWHNYGYSILAVNRVNRCFVRLARIYEKWMGRMWDFNLCVSENFKEDLTTNFLITQPIHVLYDRPSEKFVRGRLPIEVRCLNPSGKTWIVHKIMVRRQWIHKKYNEGNWRSPQSRSNPIQ